jgi:uncharacterized protein (DUF1501 family)
MRIETLIADHEEHAVSRRTFLRQLGQRLALLATPASAGILNLQLSNVAIAAPGTPNDYKALVCVFLEGGVDSYNVLLPFEREEYADYARIRGDLALNRSDLSAMSISDLSGRRFALHPGMGALRNLYNQGHVAFVANVPVWARCGTSITRGMLLS